MDKKNFFMNEALKLAKKSIGNGDIPIGAIVVLDNKIVGKGYNKKELLKDASAHAEIIALKEASKNLKTYHLEACELYVTLEPCPMCAGAIINFRLKRVYIGTKNHRFGACGSKINLLNSSFNHSCPVEFGILKDPCQKILSDFFLNLRKNR